jgi:Mrp family chromosome partitioning ATPase
MIERINYGRALRRSWRLLVALAVVFAVIAVFVPTSKPKVKAVSKYPWRSVAFLGSIPANGIGRPGVNTQTILFWADNFYVKGAAIEAAGLSKSAGDLLPLMRAGTVGFAAVGGKASGSGSGGSKSTTKTTSTTAAKSTAAKGSNYVRLIAGGSSQDLSVKLTNSYATTVLAAVNKAFATSREQLSKAQQQADPHASSGLLLVAPAINSRTSKLKPPKVVHPVGRREKGLVGLAAGLVIGALIVLARELLNKRLQSRAGAEASFLYPVIAEIPERGTKGFGAPAAWLAVVEDPTSPTAEAYRMLRMSVLFEALAPTPSPDDLYDGFGGGLPSARSAGRQPYQAPEPGSRRVVLVVSAGKEETRPAVAANLSAVYAEAGDRVIVVSTGDLDSGYAGPGAGEPTVTVRPDDLTPHLVSSRLDNVSRLSLRPFVASSGQLATRSPAIFEAARQLADVIIVESPPLLAVHHGEALIHAVDVVIVVAECGSTRISEAQRGGELLRRMGAPVLGVALTRVQLSARDVRHTAEPLPPARPALEPDSQLPPIEEATRA